MGAGDRLAWGGVAGSTRHFGGAGMELLLWGCSSPAPFGPLHGPLGTAEVEPSSRAGDSGATGSDGCGRGRQCCPSAGDTPGRRDSGGDRGARTHLPEAVGRFLRGRCRLVVGARHGCGRQSGRWAAVGQTPASCTAGRREARGWAGQPGPPAHGTSIRLSGQGWGQCPTQLQPTDPSSAHTCHPLGATQTPRAAVLGENCGSSAAGLSSQGPAQHRLSLRVPVGPVAVAGLGRGMRCPKKFSLHST